MTDHDVECDPRFRLFLHTTLEPQAVPHQLAAHTSTVFFQQSRQCIEEELLDKFMAHEKARLENESAALKQVICGVFHVAFWCVVFSMLHFGVLYFSC